MKKQNPKQKPAHVRMTITVPTEVYERMELYRKMEGGLEFSRSQVWTVAARVYIDR